MNIYSFSRYLQKWKSWFRLSLKLIHWVCLSNNPPSHCISLNSFSQTLLLIISFPSYILYNLHILIHPLVCQHILFLIHLTYFYWPSPGFPDHLLLLLPPPPMGSPITFFYWVPPFDSWFPHHSFLPRSPQRVSWSLTFTDTPLGSPKVTLGLCGTGNAATVVQLLVATATDLLLDAGLWLAAADWGVR